MNNEIEQLAEQHGMTVEFVAWFFGEKKAACGSFWLMMMAAMWEGWKSRGAESTAALATIEKCREIVGCPEGVELQDHLRQLAAENVGLKAGVAEEIEVINRGGQMYCVKDGMSINPIYARGWNDHRANVTAVQTPATDRIYAGIKADGVEGFLASLPSYGDTEVDTYDDGVKAAIETTQTVYGPMFIKQLREGADK